MKHIIMFSGGKDSLATLLATVLAVKATQAVEAIRVVFCDTGWESNETYAYLSYIEEKTGIPIIRVYNPKYPNGMPDLVRARKRFPSLKARFCTEELKVRPGIDYILSLQDDVTIYQGVRADESASRALLKRNDEYFRYYFEPFKHRSKYQQKIKALLKRIGKAKAVSGQVDFEGINLHDELRRLQQLHEVHKKPVYHSYRSKEVKAWCEQYSADVERPVLKWTAAEVISYCLNQGYKLNPLYYKGSKRVGCWPCVNSLLSEVAHIALEDPARIDLIDELEQEIDSGSAFFSNDKIPKAYQTSTHAGKKEQGKVNRVNYIRDVVRYAVGNPDQAELLDKSTVAGCISHYNICETP